MPTSKWLKNWNKTSLVLSQELVLSFNMSLLAFSLECLAGMVVFPGMFTAYL